MNVISINRLPTWVKPQNKWSTQSIICPEVLISYANSSLFPVVLKISSMDIT